MKKPSFTLFAAHLGGLGRCPFAPGTVATIAAGLPGAYLLSLVDPSTAWLVLLFLCVASCYAAHQAEQTMGVRDPSEIVIDELMGFLVTMHGLPMSWETCLGGLALFRLFDIWKPWPIHMLQERIKGGLGIVIDDVVAGIFANFLLRAALALL
jgi:phosphatidylglycerophosphatase A